MRGESAYEEWTAYRMGVMGGISITDDDRAGSTDI